VPGRKPLDLDARIVDHPDCERRFELAPGQKLEWVEQAKLDIGPGPARLSAWVSIVHPRDCERYGCYGTKIKAPDMKVTIGAGNR